MVPTGTGNQGKPGKMGRHFPVKEKSGNFVKTGKVREFYSKYWKNQKKLYWKIMWQKLDILLKKCFPSFVCTGGSRYLAYRAQLFTHWIHHYSKHGFPNYFGSKMFKKNPIKHQLCIPTVFRHVATGLGCVLILFLEVHNLQTVW